jgi:dihydrofolate reductase
MQSLTVIENVTLDGVMQAPGRADEDTRNGFAAGGWAVPYGDEVLGRAMGERMTCGGALVLGRRTYEDFAAYWPRQRDNPFTPVRDPLPWQNSRLLEGDAAEAVAALKREPGPGIGVLGSGELVRTLMAHDLVDEYVLLIHPLVLGSGRRLFADGGPPSSLRLESSAATTTGVIMATLRPSGREEDR